MPLSAYKRCAWREPSRCRRNTCGCEPCSAAAGRQGGPSWGATFQRCCHCGRPLAEPTPRPLIPAPVGPLPSYVFYTGIPAADVVRTRSLPPIDEDREPPLAWPDKEPLRPLHWASSCRPLYPLRQWGSHAKRGVRDPRLLRICRHGGQLPRQRGRGHAPGPAAGGPVRNHRAGEAASGSWGDPGHPQGYSVLRGPAGGPGQARPLRSPTHGPSSPAVPSCRPPGFCIAIQSRGNRLPLAIRCPARSSCWVTGSEMQPGRRLGQGQHRRA